MEPITLQERWLLEHGGRSWADVFYDDLGAFVYMAAGRDGLVKEYVPSEYDLKAWSVV